MKCKKFDFIRLDFLLHFDVNETKAINLLLWIQQLMHCRKKTQGYVLFNLHIFVDFSQR